MPRGSGAPDTAGFIEREIAYCCDIETGVDDVVRWYGKEGVNVGVSGMLRHYPRRNITFAVLAVGENGAWSAVKAIDEAVANSG